MRMRHRSYLLALQPSLKIDYSNYMHNLYSMFHLLRSELVPIWRQLGDSYNTQCARCIHALSRDLCFCCFCAIIFSCPADSPERGEASQKGVKTVIRLHGNEGFRRQGQRVHAFPYCARRDRDTVFFFLPAPRLPAYCSLLFLFFSVSQCSVV